MSKPALSSRLMGLKFMQRAQNKEKKAEAEEATEQRDAEAHWVIEGARTRCVVVAEGDPSPADCGAGATGRLSFRGFNEETEQLAADAAAAQAAATAEAENPGGKAVSDEAMAGTLGKGQKKQQQRTQQGGTQQQQQGQQQQQQQQQAQQQQQQQRRQKGKHGGGRQDDGRGKHGGSSGGGKKHRRDGADEGYEESAWGKGGKKPRARYF